jgi:hypothetical protein
VLHFEPVGEGDQDRPRPGPSPIHRVVTREPFAVSLPFVLEIPLDGVERADEGERLDRPRVARLGLHEVAQSVHPAPEMPDVAVHGVVAVVLPHIW